jgi:hypothetical protein
MTGTGHLEAAPAAAPDRRLCDPTGDTAGASGIDGSAPKTAVRAVLIASYQLRDRHPVRDAQRADQAIWVLRVAILQGDQRQHN